MIRRTADAGQAENIQLVIRFSGVLDQDVAPRQETGTRPAPAADDADGDDWTGADPEVALGNALLEQFAAQMAGWTDSDDADGAERRPVGLPAGQSAADIADAEAAPVQPRASAQPRVSAAQRKRERLEASHPELLDAVQAGEMTLKQAYVEAGIEKQVRTIDKLQKLWRAASDEERDRFLSWLQQQAGEQRKREYEQEVYGDE
jgi:hypothetical protein